MTESELASRKDEIELSILIPTYNEESIISHALEEIARALPPETLKKTEVLIVDDGEDNLDQLVPTLQPRMPFRSVVVYRNNPGLGKGKSLALGFQKARGRIVGFLDVDLSTTPRYINTAVQTLNSGAYDIFIGSRRGAGAKVTRQQSKIKDVLGQILGVIARNIIFLGMPAYQDTQCGFKFYFNDKAKLLYTDLVAPDGLNDIEILLRANLLEYRIKEQGVEWTDLRESKRALSRILLGEIVAMCRILWRYKLQSRSQRRILQKWAQERAVSPAARVS